MPVHTEDSEDYKTKYKAFKRKLRILIYENECFKEELRNANKALLRVKQDKSFLLDQLVPYHQTPVSSSDSDLTDCSDSEVTGHSVKRKRTGGENTLSNTNNQVNFNASQQPRPSATNNKQNSIVKLSSNGGVSKPSVAKKKSAPLPVNKPPKAPVSKTATSRPKKISKIQPNATAMEEGSDKSSLKPELSREEIEKKLAARQINNHFSIPVSLTLPPNQLFSDGLREAVDEVMVDEQSSLPEE